MKNNQIKDYIGALTQNPLPEEKILDEVPNIIIILSAYMAGLQGKKFPIDTLLHDPDIEKTIPVEFHTLVAQGAILKSKCGGLPSDYLRINVEKLLKEFKNYFQS